MIVAGLLVALVWLLTLAFYQPAWLIAVLQAVTPNAIWRVSTSSNVVAITFDDGPDPVFTPKVLDLLRAHDAKATFFLTGTNASRYPEIVARIRQEGHLIGNHLLADEYILWKPESELERSVLETERHLGMIQGPKYIRPPRMLYGEAFLRVARKHGYTIVLGSAYVSDPYRPPPRLIAWSMRRMLTRGSILVLHDAGGDRTNTIEALPAILRAGTERRLRFVTLQTLLAAAPGA